MLFINYTLADEKYISAPLLPLSSRPPHTAPSRFRPQEPEWRPEEYSFAFQLPFWLGSEALLLTHSQSIFPLYLMKYTGFSNPDGVFLVLLSGFLLFFFFLTFFVLGQGFCLQQVTGPVMALGGQYRPQSSCICPLPCCCNYMPGSPGLRISARPAERTKFGKFTAGRCIKQCFNQFSPTAPPPALV